MTRLSAAAAAVIGRVANGLCARLGISTTGGSLDSVAVAFERGIDGPDWHEERLAIRPAHVAVGTLACPLCDAPVALAYPRSPADLLLCPYCLHTAPTREFLSLDAPARPARVVVTLTGRTRGLPG
jgi:hypothetical protein